MSETFTDRQLKLELQESNDIRLTFGGRSTARNPGEFVLPIMLRSLDRAVAAKKKLVLDFRELEYMNSSTVTPVIKLLEQAKQRGCTLTVLYKKDLKWQAVSFSALEILHSNDSHIEIRGT